MSATLSYLSLAAARYGKNHPTYGARARAQAARGAGFDSIGVSLREPDIWPKPDTTILGYAHVPEAEWIDIGRPNDGIDERLLAVASELGITRVNVGVCDREPRTRDDLVRRLSELAAKTEPAGITVAVEPVAFGSLHDPYHVSAIIDAVGAPNVSILLDMWQWYQHSPAWAVNPGDEALMAQVGEIQLSGIAAARAAHHKFQASQNRPNILHSDINVGRWLAKIRNRGCDAPLSYEVPQDAHQHMPLDLIAQMAAADMSVILGPVAPMSYTTDKWCAA